MMYKLSLDKPSLEELVKNLGGLMSGRISFFYTETEEVIVYEDSQCRFCQVLERDVTASEKCRLCDMAAFNAARETKGLYLHECHAGLTKGIIPVMNDDKLLGYLMLDKLLRSDPNERTWQRVYEKCAQYNIDFNELKECFFGLGSVNLQGIHAAARVMEMCAGYISIDKLINIQHLGLMKQIEEFVIDNIDKNISISDVSRHTNFSKSYLSNKIKTQFNTPFGQYITNKKMEIAKSMLEETDLKVKQVAEKVGFCDLNYFSRMFKKATGYTPSDYRAACEKK